VAVPKNGHLRVFQHRGDRAACGMRCGVRFANPYMQSGHPEEGPPWGLPAIAWDCGPLECAVHFYGNRRTKFRCPA